uniref:hypothetical protein n=3 Tax=Helicobacter cinaedi TaxID=213 RepID=UPI001FB2EA90
QCPELRAYGEECYWKAWNKAFKEKVIERLRNPNDDFSIGSITYPDISKEKWADLIESGEVKLVVPTQGVGQGPSIIWADDSREEAQREGYKHEFETFVKKVLERGDYRVID